MHNIEEKRERERETLEKPLCMKDIVLKRNYSQSQSLQFISNIYEGKLHK